MKLFVCLIGMCLSYCLGSAQVIYDAHRNVMVTVMPDSSVQNASKVVSGYFRANGNIENSYNTLLGSLKKNGTVLDDRFAPVGYIKKDGSVQDSRYSTIGYVTKDGTVENSHHVAIGYAKGIKMEWAALIFFFFRLN